MPRDKLCRLSRPKSLFIIKKRILIFFEKMRNRNTNWWGSNEFSRWNGLNFFDIPKSDKQALKNKNKKTNTTWKWTLKR
jgi:hypothetical protein